eukprot:360793-Chlamydomonas_euryale.AAC.7
MAEAAAEALKARLARPALVKVSTGGPPWDASQTASGRLPLGVLGAAPKSAPGVAPVKKRRNVLPLASDRFACVLVIVRVPFSRAVAWVGCLHDGASRKSPAIGAVRMRW